jgi:hypothetical protein
LAHWLVACFRWSVSCEICIMVTYSCYRGLERDRVVRHNLVVSTSTTLLRVFQHHKSTLYHTHMTHTSCTHQFQYQRVSIVSLRHRLHHRGDVLIGICNELCSLTWWVIIAMHVHGPRESITPPFNCQSTLSSPRHRQQSTDDIIVLL